MKISILIPSKNRLDLLKHALASVLSQERVNIEVVVSDNASTEEYGAYLESLADVRISYFRQPTPVPVTENWAKALSLATGDYVLMLGDDDALCPGFAEEVRPFLTDDGPELLYLSAYHYGYPGVFSPGDPGYVAKLWWEFVEPGDGPSCLVPAFSRELARSVLQLRHRYGYNAQHFLLKREFIDRFSAIGGLYQSPYPDFFAATVVFQWATNIVVLPTETVIIGISPKSFGAYYFSDRQNEGFSFLDNRQIHDEVRGLLDEVFFPGDQNNTNWLISAEMARRVIADETDEQVDVDRYHLIQILSLLRDRFVLGKPDERAFAEASSRLSRRENMLLGLLLSVLRSSEGEEKSRLFAAMTREVGQYPPSGYSGLVDIGDHRTISDAISWLREKAPSGSDIEVRWLVQPKKALGVEPSGSPTQGEEPSALPPVAQESSDASGSDAVAHRNGGATGLRRAVYKVLRSLSAR